MRLIDADVLKKAMDGYWGRCQRIRKPRNGETAVFLDVMATVEKQPTIDAVPVIRCKDCKHYFPEGHVRCWNIRGMHYPVEPDEFCSRAERKEE